MQLPRRQLRVKGYQGGSAVNALTGFGPAGRYSTVVPWNAQRANVTAMSA